MNAHYVATSLLVALDVSGSRVEAADTPREVPERDGDVVAFPVQLDGKAYTVVVTAD